MISPVLPHAARYPRLGCVAWKLGSAWTLFHQSVKPSIADSAPASGVTLT